MKIGFKKDLETAMDAWVKEQDRLNHLLRRAQIESLYNEKARLRRTRRIKDNG